MEWALILVPLAYLYFTPFTKVEESFNIQATHDILYHRWNISQYDHHDFPGVVPRTFIGPLFISILASPLFYTANLLNFNKFIAQYFVRIILSLCVSLSILRLQRALRSVFGNKWSWWYLAITISQYHVLYYSSRPLPNMLALPLVLLAISEIFLQDGTKRFLLLSGAAIIWFRTELALLLGLVLILQILSSRITVNEAIRITVPTGVVLVAATLVIDSIFWLRPVWPELEVFYFNAILNKSSDWGTSPFLWYFYSALPRGLGSSFFLIPIGLFLESRTRPLVSAAFAFILLFSFLPHKELRFIIYTFPILNIAVAAACHRLWENRGKSAIRWLLGVGAASHLAFNVLLTVFLLMVAKINYPGGEAMSLLHQIVPSDVPVHVHIGNLAAQTGVTRFTQLNPNWRYSKKENLIPGSPEILQFTHLLVEAKSKYSTNLKPYKNTHTILASVEGFSEIVMNPKILPPVRIKTKPLLFILQRNSDVLVPELEEHEVYSQSDEVLYEEEEEEMTETDTESPEADSPEDVGVDQTEDLSKSQEEHEDLVDQAEEFSKSEEEPKDTVDQNFQNDLNKSGEDVVEPLEIVEETTPEEDVSEETTNEISEPESIVTNENEQLVGKTIIDEEDDLLAMESKNDEKSFEFLMKELEDRLSSKESQDDGEKNNFNDALLDADILNDIKSLSNADLDGADIGKLKEALRGILAEYKDHMDNAEGKEKDR